MTFEEATQKQNDLKSKLLHLEMTIEGVVYKPKDFHIIPVPENQNANYDLEVEFATPDKRQLLEEFLDYAQLHRFPPVKENEMWIEFVHCIQDSQEYGSTNEHMVSRLFFDINRKQYYCNIRQPFGENFSFETTPIEVETPSELKQIVNYNDFRDAAENYYRTVIQSLVQPGGAFIRMWNNHYGIIIPYKIRKVEETSGAW